MTLLTKRLVEKPWGKDTLPPPFTAPAGKRIGEVWFEPPPELPTILVKYIFTSEKLSVQVHPSDAQAKALGESDRGKEECWLVIDAEPGATLGVGFKQPIDADTMRTAALDGSIEDLLMWHPVQAGDFFYIPAGTVHAIGAGVSLIEIQQNSDITYRLFDYGRPRELHLDQGIAVALGEPYDPALRCHLADTGTEKLIQGSFFTVHWIDGAPDATLLSDYAGACLVIPRTGTVHVGDDVIRAGDCGYVSSLRDASFDIGSQAVLVRPA